MTAVMDTEKVRALYDQKARTWKWAAIPDALLGINRLRRKHFSGVTGDVLDVGCGTGENFKYLFGADNVEAVDLSPEMVSRARDRAGAIGLAANVVVADAAALPYDHGSFDFVISAFSSCTFPDYVAAFQEMTRVTRPGGRVLLAEHGRSSVGWISRRQDASFDKHFQTTACRTNRDPLAELTQAGVGVTSREVSHLGMLNRFVIDVV